MPVKIVAFAGSARRGSLNKKLVAVAADGARRVGAQVTLIDLSDYPMPLYDGDEEDSSGLPGYARTLKQLFAGADGLLIACPEYNSSITPLLKNTIDWLSRKEGDEPKLVAFAGKAAGLVSASPGALGGLRGLVHVRAILGNIGVHVIPEQKALGNAVRAFAEDGSIADESDREAVMRIGARVAETACKLRA